MRLANRRREQIGVARVERFGSGCTGSAGIPAIGTSGIPAIGSTTFQVRLEGARASSPAGLLLSPARSDLPLGFGCTLYLSPVLVVAIATSTNTVGSAAVPLPFPNVASHVGVNLYFQYGVLDPAGAYGGVFAASNAVRVVIGRS